MQPENCPVERTLNAVGAKWTPMILLLLGGGDHRFGELQRALPALSPRVLTDRLRTLELLGLVTRTVHAEVPPRVDYALTPRGRELVGFLDRVAEWYDDEDGPEPVVAVPPAVVERPGRPARDPRRSRHDDRRPWRPQLVEPVRPPEPAA